VATYSEDFAILSCTILIGLKSATDGWADGQTDGRPDTTIMAKIREALQKIAALTDRSLNDTFSKEIPVFMYTSS